MSEKILFANRKNCLSHPGGDTVQMIKTKEFIEKKYSVAIDICIDLQQILSNKEAKIVHIFNLQTIDETLNYINACKRSNKKIALSTIYWDLSHMNYISVLSSKLCIYPNISYFCYFKDLINKVLNFIGIFMDKKELYGSRLYKNKRKEALIESDIILPNSSGELKIISKEFDLDIDYLTKKSYIVPNAVDTKSILQLSKNELPIIGSIKNFILEVGRIEPIKNQINVVRALYNMPDIPIVFIGRIQDKRYYYNLDRLAKKRGNVYFIEELPYAEVFEFYKKASVHVMPSYRESPGLSSLEALISGCEIVVSSSEFCPIEFYEFDKFAHICNPYDVKSIKNAIIQAFNNKKNVNLSDYYNKKYGYENVADITYSAYKSLI